MSGSGGFQRWDHKVPPEGHLPQGQERSRPIRACTERLQGATMTVFLGSLGRSDVLIGNFELKLK